MKKVDDVNTLLGNPNVWHAWKCEDAEMGTAVQQSVNAMVKNFILIYTLL